MNKSERGLSESRYAALVGIMAATIECGKLALSFIPNVEVVTILIALYSYTFGWCGVVASVVFVAIEPMIYGVGSWLLTSAVYWPLVAVVFMLFGKSGIKNRLVITATGVGLTLFFGVFSSLVDVGLFSGYFDNFFYRFGIYYARGIVFYIIQTVCNLVLFSLTFNFLSQKLSLIKRRFL